jgi:hypothetical protein
MAKKTVNITIYKSELIFDVRNRTHLTGESRKSGDNYEQVANMKVSADDEHMAQILRSIATATAIIQTKMAEYIISTTGTSTNELIDADTDIAFELSMPSNYNMATIDAITQGIHQYIVNTAVAEWFDITDKADASDYLSAAAANLNVIREAINKRERPIRTAPTKE